MQVEENPLYMAMEHALRYHLCQQETSHVRDLREIAGVNSFPFLQFTIGEKESDIISLLNESDSPSAPAPSPTDEAATTSFASPLEASAPASATAPTPVDSPIALTQTAPTQCHTPTALTQTTTTPVSPSTYLSNIATQPYFADEAQRQNAGATSSSEDDDRTPPYDANASPPPDDGHVTPVYSTGEMFGLDYGEMLTATTTDPVQQQVQQ